MKQDEMISYIKNRRKNRKKSTTTKEGTSTSSLISGGNTQTTKKATPIFETSTMVNGKSSLSTDFNYDRTLFNQIGTNREKETSKQWSQNKKKQLQLQKPPPVMMNQYDSLTGSYSEQPSTEKRYAIDPTTDKSLKNVRTEGDHIASLFTVQQMVTPPSTLSTDFVKNKWKVREGGTTNLSPKQMQGLYLTDHIQITSKKANRAKGAKRIADYRLEGGWGGQGVVSKEIAVKQAQGYHDSLLEVAKNFGKRGGFSREDAQAYTEITGKQSDPLLDGSNPKFSPPSTKSNITGFDAYGDARRAKDKKEVTLSHRPIKQPAQHMYHRESAKEIKEKHKMDRYKKHIESIGGKWSNVVKSMMNNLDKK